MAAFPSASQTAPNNWPYRIIHDVTTAAASTSTTVVIWRSSSSIPEEPVTRFKRSWRTRFKRSWSSYLKMIEDRRRWTERAVGSMRLELREYPRVVEPRPRQTVLFARRVCAVSSRWRARR